MPSLLISHASPADLKLVAALLKKMNIAARIVPDEKSKDEEKEDAGLKLLMRQAAGAPRVSRSTVMRKLGRA